MAFIFENLNVNLIPKLNQQGKMEPSCNERNLIQNYQTLTKTVHG